jgi:hypothetical protein
MGLRFLYPSIKKNGNINPDGFRGNFVKRQGANPDKFGPNEVLLGLSLIKWWSLFHIKRVPYFGLWAETLPKLRSPKGFEEGWRNLQSSGGLQPIAYLYGIAIFFKSVGLGRVRLTNNRLFCMMWRACRIFFFGNLPNLPWHVQFKKLFFGKFSAA